MLAAGFLPNFAPLVDFITVLFFNTAFITFLRDPIDDGLGPVLDDEEEEVFIARFMASFFLFDPLEPLEAGCDFMTLFIALAGLLVVVGLAFIAIGLFKLDFIGVVGGMLALKVAGLIAFKRR